MAFAAFHSQYDLLCGLGLLLQDGLGLTTKTGLLSVVTSLTYAGVRGLWHSDVYYDLNDNKPWARREAAPVLYWVTLWGVCFLQTVEGQNVLRVLGMLTISDRGKRKDDSSIGSTPADRELRPP